METLIVSLAHGATQAPLANYSVDELLSAQLTFANRTLQHVRRNMATKALPIFDQWVRELVLRLLPPVGGRPQ